jgi:ABC-type histidine transport system ATPase subunit
VSEAVIEIADLCKNFGALPVLRGVSLQVERASVVAIIGPSGSGKSTLVGCINLLARCSRRSGPPIRRTPIRRSSQASSDNGSRIGGDDPAAL